MSETPRRLPAAALRVTSILAPMLALHTAGLGALVGFSGATLDATAPIARARTRTTITGAATKPRRTLAVLPPGTPQLMATRHRVLGLSAPITAAAQRLPLQLAGLRAASLTQLVLALQLVHPALSKLHHRRLLVRLPLDLSVDLLAEFLCALLMARPRVLRGDEAGEEQGGDAEARCSVRHDLLPFCYDDMLGIDRDGGPLEDPVQLHHSAA